MVCGPGSGNPRRKAAACGAARSGVWSGAGWCGVARCGPMVWRGPELGDTSSQLRCETKRDQRRVVPNALPVRGGARVVHGFTTYLMFVCRAPKTEICQNAHVRSEGFDWSACSRFQKIFLWPRTEERVPICQFAFAWEGAFLAHRTGHHAEHDQGDPAAVPDAEAVQALDRVGRFQRRGGGPVSRRRAGGRRGRTVRKRLPLGGLGHQQTRHRDEGGETVRLDA